MKKIYSLFFLSLLLTVTMQAQTPADPDIDRSNWTVTTETATNYGNVTDGDTGSGSPQEMFDDDPATFLSLIKPGKNGIYNITDPQPADFIPSFIVNMQSPKTFNYIKWTHRTHASNYLRVYGIKLEGSNDGTAFTPINDGELIWIPNIGGYVGTVNTNDPATYTIVVPQSTYQYVKVILAMWSDIYNSQHPDYPGVGSTSGTCMQLGEFGLGKYEPRIVPVADRNFGDVLVGGTATQTITVSGISVSAITATIGGDDANAFSVTPQPSVNGKFPFTLTFSPTVKKVYNATLTLSGTGVDPVTVQLTGNADFDLPVRISNETDTYWYYLQFYRKAANNLVWALSDTTKMIVQDTLKVSNAATRTDMQWKITGDWENGYQIINRKTDQGLRYNDTEYTESSITTPADRYLVDDFGGNMFGFVRFSTTDAWQFVNLDIEGNPAYKYVNDQSGRHLCHYSLNDGGNRLKFIPAGRSAIAVPVDDLTLEVPAGATVAYTLSVTGLATTGNISANITGAEAGVFSLSDGSLAKEGGSLTLTFAPSATKRYTAVLVLSSTGADDLKIPLVGNSDLGLPKFSTADNEVWYYIQFVREVTNGLVWENAGLEEKVLQSSKEDDKTAQHWKFVGTWKDGVKIVNAEGGEMFFDDENIKRYILVDDGEGDLHTFYRQNTTTPWALYNVNKADGSYKYLNDFGGVNTHDGVGLYAVNDGGNPLNFIPVIPEEPGVGINLPASDLNDKLVATKYYNLQGAKITRPLTTGIYIEQKVYVSGKTQSTKKFFVVR